MRKNRPALFRGRHFEDEIILLCVRWYLRYSLSYRDLEEMMAERGLAVDHSTVWRWVQHYAPMLNRRLRRELRHPDRSWRVDETYIREVGKWTYLYRAVDSEGGSVATSKVEGELGNRPWRNDELLAETEKGSKHPDLSAKVGSGNPEHLPFANHLHCLDPRNHRARSRHRSWPLHRA